MTDAEIQAAIDRAARYFVSELAPIVLIQDVDALAARMVATIMSSPDRWRPIPEPPEWRRMTRPVAPTPEYLAEKAALNTSREDTPDHAT